MLGDFFSLGQIKRRFPTSKDKILTLLKVKQIKKPGKRSFQARKWPPEKGHMFKQFLVGKY
jgi:hypothetical protein